MDARNPREEVMPRTYVEVDPARTHGRFAFLLMQLVEWSNGENRLEQDSTEAHALALKLLETAKGTKNIVLAMAVHEMVLAAVHDNSEFNELMKRPVQ